MKNVSLMLLTRPRDLSKARLTTLSSTNFPRSKLAEILPRCHQAITKVLKGDLKLHVNGFEISCPESLDEPCSFSLALARSVPASKKVALSSNFSFLSDYGRLKSMQAEEPVRRKLWASIPSSPSELWQFSVGSLTVPCGKHFELTMKVLIESQLFKEFILSKKSDMAPETLKKSTWAAKEVSYEFVKLAQILATRDDKYINFDRSFGFSSLTQITARSLPDVVNGKHWCLEALSMDTLSFDIIELLEELYRLQDLKRSISNDWIIDRGSQKTSFSDFPPKSLSLTTLIKDSFVNLTRATKRYVNDHFLFTPKGLIAPVVMIRAELSMPRSALLDRLLYMLNNKIFDGRLSQLELLKRIVIMDAKKSGNCSVKFFLDGSVMADQIAFKTLLQFLQLTMKVVDPKLAKSLTMYTSPDGKAYERIKEEKNAEAEASLTSVLPFPEEPIPDTRQVSMQEAETKEEATLAIVVTCPEDPVKQKEVTEYSMSDRTCNNTTEPEQTEPPKTEQLEKDQNVNAAPIPSIPVICVTEAPEDEELPNVATFRKFATKEKETAPNKKEIVQEQAVLKQEPVIPTPVESKVPEKVSEVSVETSVKEESKFKAIHNQQESDDIKSTSVSPQQPAAIVEPKRRLVLTTTMSKISRSTKNLTPSAITQLNQTENPTLVSLTAVPSTIGVSAVEEIPLPTASKLLPVNFASILKFSPNFYLHRKVPSDSPFNLLEEPLDFWVHRGELGEVINEQKLFRVFKPYQMFNSLESLLMNYNFSVIQIFSELAGQNNLGLFKSKAPLATNSASRLTIPIKNESTEDDLAIARLNISFINALLLLVDSQRSWANEIQGFFINPASQEFFWLEVWFNLDIEESLLRDFKYNLIEKLMLFNAQF